MKKLPLLIVIVAIAVTLFMGSFQQTQGLTSDTQQKNTHKVGLIDMAKVFKEYEKFTSQREQLKTEIERKQAIYQPLKDQLTILQKKLTNKDIKDGPEKRAWQKELITKTAEYQSQLKQDEIEFMRREADIYKEIYQEVQTAVQQYSEYFGYSVVLRYSSEGLNKETNPRGILDKMNRLVVYNSPQIDITVPVLKHLNDKYKQQTNNGAPNRRN